MADAKTYSRRTLEQILRVVCAHDGEERELKRVLPYFDLKDDGLWLAERDPNLVDYEREFFEWHGRGNADLPALPIPFTAHEFAAFCLDGGGYFVHARFDNGTLLDEEALRDLGPNSHEACEVLRDVHQLLLDAGERFGTADESAPERAQWLLSQPEREPQGLTTAPTTASEPAAVRHTMKGRANPLAAVIARAKAEALDPTDWTSTWAALVELAKRSDRPPPLLGYTAGEGIKYQTDKEEPDKEESIGWLNREAWRKRAARGA